MTTLYFVNLLFSIAWAAVTGSFTLVNLILGFCLGSLALFIIREQVGTNSYFNRAIKILQLFGTFIYELVLSSLRVAKIVLSPKINLKPRIIAYPLTVDRDFEITLLANLITLTPGTLSVDVSTDRKFLFVHCIDAPDQESTIMDIRQSFERRIMEAFR